VIVGGHKKDLLETDDERRDSVVYNVCNSFGKSQSPCAAAATCERAKRNEKVLKIIAKSVT